MINDIKVLAQTFSTARKGLTASFSRTIPTHVENLV